MQNAEKGIRELEKYVDSLIVVPNEKLLEIADENTSLDEAFILADQILRYGVSGISDLVAVPGLINLDLADVRRIMTQAGVCHMGIGRASGEGRAAAAIRQAINSPLLDTTIDGARGVIMNFTGGRDMKIREVDEAASIVRDAVSPDADIIFGATHDETMNDEIMITVIASGFDKEAGSVGREFESARTKIAAQPAPVTPTRPEPFFGTEPKPAFGFEKPAVPESRPAAPESDPSIPDFLSGSSTFNTAAAAPRSVDPGFHTVGSSPADESPKFSFDAADEYQQPAAEAPAPPLNQDTAEAPSYDHLFNAAGKSSTYTDLAASQPEPARTKEPEPIRPPQKSKPSRMLPWFLQDNDSRYND